MEPRVTILVVDPQAHRRLASQTLLASHGYLVVTVGSVSEGVEITRGTANLTVVVAELELDGGHSATFLHRQVAEILDQRGGLFLVTTDAVLTALPGKMWAQYCQECEIPIFHRPVDWTGLVLPMLAEHAGRMAG